jgi:hypothetical protein
VRKGTDYNFSRDLQSYLYVLCTRPDFNDVIILNVGSINDGSIITPLPFQVSSTSWVPVAENAALASRLIAMQMM